VNENDSSLKNVLLDAERQAVERALAITSGNKRRAAKLLGIQRCVLYQKLKKHRLCESTAS
jgi:DNA-binding NtrC family response regulator